MRPNIDGQFQDRDLRISEHGYQELANDDLTAREIVGELESAIPIENYPNYPKRASVLVLQAEKKGQPDHVVWGIPKEQERPAVLVTAYRPDPERWRVDFVERKRWICVNRSNIFTKENMWQRLMWNSSSLMMNGHRI